ncbi:hypothetical protein KFL_008010010 [Klebsormidium nitens]|uniref:Coenzyme Q-binding protein COQ10 START domain-containing protein n=1 Tax=Klebsormidium nitens TaxID=105231 RepID=A0A1Y1IS14_KLENI|nr:hypothetical protein KFL_008010010 [Klebsormidium nitens]|eukprot:GAQ91526.1 hypothetical protein KFL_008010010 [Klebsormidium nitens]
MADLNVPDLPQAQIDFKDDHARSAVQMRAVYKVPMPASRVYDILTDPDEFTRVFKKKFRGYRNLIIHEDDGGGIRSKEMELQQWYNVLVWRGTLTTHMHFEEDRRQLAVDFRLGRQGMMKIFEGRWEITPMTEQQKGLPMTQVTLYQTMKAHIPGVPRRAFPLRRFTKKVTEDMVADFRREAAENFSKEPSKLASSTSDLTI